MGSGWKLPPARHVVGDFNGDGNNDLALAVYNNNAGGTDAGAVQIWYGPIAQGDYLFGSADVQIRGGPGDFVGSTYAMADFNGDGLSDIAVNQGAYDLRVVYGGGY